MIEIIRGAIQPSSGARLLDVGCGRGRLLDTLRREMPGLRLIGLERDLGRATDAHLLTQAPIILGDGQLLPFRPATFDLVVLGYALHHMSPSVRKGVLVESRKVLRPDGRLLVIEKASPRSPWGRLRLLMQVVSGLENRQVYSLFGQGLVTQLEAAGLEIMTDQRAGEKKSRRVVVARLTTEPGKP